MNDGWIRDWFGYERHISTVNEMDSPKSRCEEIQWFRWVASQLEDRPFVTIVEAGAGYGPWSMALAGLRNGKAYKCIAIEANPEYVELTKRHFERQGIKGEVIHSAISDFNGVCKFDTNFLPFGQGITYTGRIKGSRVLAKIWGFLHIATGNITKVRTETLDTLLDRLGISRVHILQMDIQGAEVKAIKGLKKHLKEGSIEYLMIGTHHESINFKLMRIISRGYKLKVNILPRHGEDGLQVWEPR